MSIAQIVVTAAGLGAIAGVAWFFWGPRRQGVRAGHRPRASLFVITGKENNDD